ncbi:MAG: hypothetical protein QXF07_01355 [Candidatus Micrarchaeia archaeon]
MKQKVQIGMEPLSATNIAELCRRHRVSVAKFHRRKDRFIGTGKRIIVKSSKENEYEKEIDNFKCLASIRPP